MRVLITGATGFIGHALAQALLRQGHNIVCAVRDPSRLELTGPGWQALQVDLETVPGAAWWQPHLQGVDAVVNAVGILRQTGGRSFDALHARAPIELFTAAAAAGVKTVVQVSALGADGRAQSHYHLSKKAADDRLRALPVAGAVVQPSAVYGAKAASAGMFNTLALMPLLMLPQAGAMPMRPVHVDDVIDGILAVLRQPPPQVATIAFVGPQPLSMASYLRELRGAMGLGNTLPLVLPMPQALFIAGARLAGLSDASALDADTARMLLRGNTAPVEDFQHLLGHSPRPVREFIAPRDAETVRSETVRALLGPLRKVALGGLGAALAVLGLAWLLGAPLPW